MKKHAILEHLIFLLHNLYIDQEATVHMEEGETEWLKISKGVQQGCMLSPYLFNLYAEQIIREAGLYENKRCVKIGGRLINNLHYADDTTLLTISEDDLKHLLLKIKEHSLNTSLHFNVKKTKILTTGKINNIIVDRK